MSVTRLKGIWLLVLATGFALTGGCPTKVGDTGADSGLPIPIPTGADSGLPIPIPLPDCKLQVLVDGAGAVDPDGGTFAAGDSVILEAVPDRNWRFVCWEGDVGGEDLEKNPLALRMDADRTLTAVFVKTFELTVDTEGNGAVLIEMADGTAVGESPFDDGAELTLTAEPEEGWVFLQWEGDVSARHEADNPVTVTVDDDLVVTAVFIREYVLTTDVEGEGEVEPSGGAFPEGTEVILTATPAEDHMFARWSGDVDPDYELDNPLEFVIEDDCDITAVFLDTRIKPGQSIGPIRLGDTWKEVVDVLGAPDDIWASSLLWNVYFEYDATGIHGRLDDRDRDGRADPSERVEALTVYDPFPGKYKGLCIGSSKNDVVDVLGAPEYIGYDGDYWYWSRGIKWGLSGSRVVDIHIFEPL